MLGAILGVTLCKGCKAVRECPKEGHEDNRLEGKAHEEKLMSLALFKMEENEGTPLENLGKTSSLQSNSGF